MYLVLRIIKTIMLYLSSDWFAELGFTFFNYHYTAKLIKSSYNLKCLLLKLTYRYLDNQPLNDADIRKLQDIIKIIAKEASMDKRLHKINIDMPIMVICVTSSNIFIKM